MQKFGNNIELSLRWILENRNEFSLRHAQTSEERLQLLKPLGELSLTLDVIQGDRPDHRASSLLEWCWGELQEGRTLVEILSVRPDLVVAATLYVCFRRAGLRNRQLELLIRHLRASPSARNVELPTWRRLDILHGFEALGVDQFPAEAESNTWFGNLPEPWTITDDIAYSLTHNVFYITDFGSRLDRLSGDAKTFLEIWLPSWLEIYSEQENWDLFAELLMVSSCLGLQDRHVAEFDRLAATQDMNGMFFGPPNSAKNLLNQSLSASRISFLKNYHTTLVSLMAFVLFNMPESKPPPRASA